MPVPPSSGSEPRTLVTHPELRSHQSFPMFQSLGEAPKSALERGLSFFADVRAGECFPVELFYCASERSQQPLRRQGSPGGAAIEPVAAPRLFLGVLRLVAALVFSLLDQHSLPDS